MKKSRKDRVTNREAPSNKLLEAKESPTNRQSMAGKSLNFQGRNILGREDGKAEHARRPIEWGEQKAECQGSE